MPKDQHDFNILVIEDNPGDYTLITDYLLEQISRPIIVHAENFSQSQSILQTNKNNFNVILLDLSLPDKSGKNLVAEILPIAFDCPVIVLTGFSDVEFSIHSISQGISDYLLKDDLNASSLYKSIIYCMERKRQMLELKASEKRYSNLFHLSPQPMWLYDPETYRFMQVNKAAMELYEYTEEEFLNMTIMDLLAEEQDQKENELVNKGTSRKGNIFKGTFRHTKKSGDLIDIEIYSTPIMLYEKLFKTVIAIDVTEKILFEYKLTRAIIKTQEDERYEIGSELHDNVCQILATSQLSLGMLKETLDPSVERWYNQCDKSLVLAANEIRNLSHRLAPAFFDNASLEDTFRLLFNDFNVEKKYTVTIDFNKKLKKYVLNRDIQLNAYRIMQEQLRNIQKYAQASNIRFTMLILHNKLKMELFDDGIGFDVKAVKGGIGLANMKRRAELFHGKFGIASSPGNGCAITVEIPLKEMKAKIPNSKPLKTIRQPRKKPIS
ncbi:MAG: PAS domain S-box protein [Flavitalea sp.]